MQFIVSFWAIVLTDGSAACAVCFFVIFQLAK